MQGKQNNHNNSRMTLGDNFLNWLLFCSNIPSKSYQNHCFFLMLVLCYVFTCDASISASTRIKIRITALKRSKAGHLGEMQRKIWNRLDEVLKDYRFSNEVKGPSCRLKDQWTRFACSVCDEFMKHFPGDTDLERASESDRRFNDQTRAYERCSVLIEHYLARANLPSGEIESRAVSDMICRPQTAD